MEIRCTVKLGSHKSVPELKAALALMGEPVKEYVEEIFDQPAFVLAGEETEVDLIALSATDLGLPEGARICSIISTALERGFELCPPEVGPQLRLQHPHLLDGVLRIAMQAVTCGRFAFVFSIHPQSRGYGNEDVIKLGFDYKWAERHESRANTYCVFVVPRK